MTDILDRGITDHWKQNFYLDESQAIYLHQADVDLEILPPCYIQAAGSEVFIAQINDFSERLKGAGCQLEYEEFPGQFHVFQTFAPLVREAQGAINKIGAFTRSL